MNEESAGGYIAAVLIMMAIWWFVLPAVSPRPDCQAGFKPMRDALDGWKCLAGYKQ